MNCRLEPVSRGWMVSRKGRRGGGLLASVGDEQFGQTSSWSGPQSDGTGSTRARGAATWNAKERGTELQGTRSDHV